MYRVVAIIKDGNKTAWNVSDGQRVVMIGKDRLVSLINHASVDNAKIQLYKGSVIIRYKGDIPRINREIPDDVTAKPENRNQGMVENTELARLARNYKEAGERLQRELAEQKELNTKLREKGKALMDKYVAEHKEYEKAVRQLQKLQSLREERDAAIKRCRELDDIVNDLTQQLADAQARNVNIANDINSSPEVAESDIFGDLFDYMSGRVTQDTSGEGTVSNKPLANGSGSGEFGDLFDYPDGDFDIVGDVDDTDKSVISAIGDPEVNKRFDEVLIENLDLPKGAPNVDEAMFDRMWTMIDGPGGETYDRIKKGFMESMKDIRSQLTMDDLSTSEKIMSKITEVIDSIKK